MTSFKQVHGRTGSTALSGPSQTLSLASSSGTPCSAGAQALCPRRPAGGYSRAEPAHLHGRPALPLGGPSVRSAHQSRPGPLSRDPTLPPRSLPSKDTRWALSLAGHTPLKKPVLQILQAPCSCTTTARGPQDMWPPPTFRGSCSLRYQLPLRPPGVLSQGQALTALPPSRPTVTPDWQRSPEPGDHSDLTPSVYTPTNELC